MFKKLLLALKKDKGTRGERENIVPFLKRYFKSFTWEAPRVPLLKGDTAHEGLLREISRVIEEGRGKLAELSRVRAESDAIIDSIAEGLFVVDVNQHILMMNTAGRNMLGFRAGDEIRGKKVYGIIRMENENGMPVKETERPLFRTLSYSESIITPAHKHYYYINALQTYPHRIPVRIVTAPIVIEGDIKGAVSIFRDVTEELTISRAKNEFISFASHQLRTPLSIITLNLNAIRKYHLKHIHDEEARFSLQEAEDAAKRMAILIKSLLDVSKIELGTLDVQYGKINLEELITQEVKDFEPLFSKKKLGVHVFSPREPLYIMGDQELIRVVINNIFSNAVKYSNEGGPIKVTYGVEHEHAVVHVLDEGHGIPKHQQQYVFSKLFRGDNVAQFESGTGLGLYISKSIVEKHGGDITFTSRENKGTIFTVSFPLL